MWITILQFFLWPVVIYLSYRIILYAVRNYEKKFKV
jgi:hypothetical protein